MSCTSAGVVLPADVPGVKMFKQATVSMSVTSFTDEDQTFGTNTYVVPHCEDASHVTYGLYSAFWYLGNVSGTDYYSYADGYWGAGACLTLTYPDGSTGAFDSQVVGGPPAFPFDNLKGFVGTVEVDGFSPAYNTFLGYGYDPLPVDERSSYQFAPYPVILEYHRDVPEQGAPPNAPLQTHRRWAADVWPGGVCLVWIDSSTGTLKSSLNRQVARALVDGTQGWSSPQTIDTRVEECNVGLTDAGRALVFYTTVDVSNGRKCLTRAAESGGEEAWSAATDITLSGGYPTQPCQNLNGHWPLSPSVSSGLYAYDAARQPPTFRHGQGGALWMAPGEMFDPGNGVIRPLWWRLADDGNSATAWQVEEAPASSNETGTSPLQPRPNFYNAYNLDGFGFSTFGDDRVGKHYDNIVPGANVGGGPIVASAIVRLRDGTLAQLVYSPGYSRTSPLTPTNWVQTSHAQAFTWAVPADANTLTRVRWSFTAPRAAFALAPIVGVVDNPAHPNKVTFAIPSLPWLSGGDTLIGSIRFSYVVTDAQAWKMTVGNGTNTAAAFTRAGGFEVLDMDSGANLSSGDQTAIAGAAGGNVTLPVVMSGSYGSLNLKSVSLILTSVYTNAVAFGSNLSVSGSSHNAQNPVSACSGQQLWVEAPNGSGVDSNAALLADVSAAHGSVMNLSLNYLQGTSYTDSGGVSHAVGSNLPNYFNIIEGFAVTQYDDGTAGSFRLLRSRDNGRNWEYAQDAGTIALLNTLRDYNRTVNTSGTTPPLLSDRACPILLAVGDTLMAVWEESGNPKAIFSEDVGETWVG